MAKIGYIMTAPGYNDYEADVKWMEEFGCVEIVREDLPQNEKSRTLWDSLIGRILNAANIELTRGHTRGPLGPWKKKEDAE